MSPTKLVVAGEGGLVTTNDDSLAKEVRMGREYGDPGDYNTAFAGLNGRLSEFHAATALLSLERLDDHVAARQARAKRYVDGLADVPGVRTPTIAVGDEGNYKDFTVMFDESFGLDRDGVAVALDAEGIETRRYFWPPVHRQQAYAHVPKTDLPVTDAAAGCVLSLPMFGDLAEGDVDRVIQALRAIHDSADAIRDRIGPGRRAPMVSRSSARD
jgi:dTDP-4-amino-4,6-dideoxygalactose transaminase